MPTEEQIALLAPFCDEGSVRYCLDKPFVQNKRLFATNGKIAAWLDCDEPDTVPVEGRFPKMEAIIDLETRCDEPFPWSPPACERCNGLRQIAITDCPECKKTGKCQACFGFGTATCDSCGQPVDCDDCDGTGKCPECLGKSTTDEYFEPCDCLKGEIRLFDGSIDSIVASKISQLTGVKIGRSDRSQLPLVAFESDDGVRGVFALRVEVKP